MIKISLQKILIILVGIFFVLQAVSVFRIALIGDDTEALHAAWLVKQGYEPYQDFFEHHHSFYYYFLSLFLIKGRETIMLARFSQMLIHFLSLFFLYKIVKKAGFDKKAVLLYLFLIGSAQPFIWSSIQTRPDSVMFLCSLIGIYLYFVSLKPNNKQREQSKQGEQSLVLLLSGMAMGLSFLFLQKALFLLIPLVMLILYDILFLKKRFRRLLYFAGGFLLIISPYYLSLLTKNLLSTYWFFNFTVNKIWPVPGGGWWGRFSLVGLFIRNPLVWLLIPVTLLYYLCKAIKRLRTKKPEITLRGKLFFLALFQFLYILSLPIYFKRFLGAPYLIAFLPLSLIFAALLLNKQKIAVILVFCSLLFLLATANYFKWIFHIPENNLAQRYILQNTVPTDKVWSFKPMYHPIFRKDADYCWFLQDTCSAILGKPLKEIDEYIAHVITTQRPKVIYLDNQEYTKTNTILKKNYSPSLYIHLWLRKE